MVKRFSSKFLLMNSGIVYNQGSAYLVDPGVFPEEILNISRFFKSKDIKHLALLLTHTHGDHISGWHKFSQWSTYSHEIAGKKSQESIDHELRYLKGIYRKAGYIDHNKLAFPDKIELVKEGEIINIPPYTFTFYQIPGHSSDMCAIHIPEKKLLFSGDMLIQRPTPFILHSIRKYFNSLHKLINIVREQKIQLLIAGHGKPATSQHEILNRLSYELDYIKSIVRYGYELSNLSDANLAKKLYNFSGKYLYLHSHCTNVQTLLRERDTWHTYEFL